MKIKLIGELPSYMSDMGLKPGECFDAEPEPGTRLDALRFFIIDEFDEVKKCVVMPKNYKKL